ncbi:protein kinase family protein [Phaeacidiphilus oryzae]|uniref:protein kinase family protein n=1 Tax=Phaeacidiphilus oryzae TaxID=348818 RepID=UPI00068EAC72
MVGVAPIRHSGDRIAGRYRLEECISQAGVFTSWRAVDEKLSRAVGVHLLSSGNQRAQQVLAAARSAALFGDLRFVQVLDAVESTTEPARPAQEDDGPADGPQPDGPQPDGALVYVLREWLPRATDLGTLIARAPLEPHEAYQMIRQVSDAMAAAHRRGMAHLRLTPSCVLRSETGQYRINGLAVDAALHGLSAEPGRPGAADAADGPAESAEVRDTRAMGALLYASLTGRWPTEEDRYGIPGLPRGTGEAAPDQIRAGVHRGLSDLAARCLFRDPGRRLAPITTPAELADAVAELPRIRPPQPATVTGAASAPGLTSGVSGVASPLAPNAAPGRGGGHGYPGYAGGGQGAPPRSAPTGPRRPCPAVPARR